jgi:hypothetical protein
VASTLHKSSPTTLLRVAGDAVNASGGWGRLLVARPASGREAS